MRERARELLRITTKDLAIAAAVAALSFAAGLAWAASADAQDDGLGVDAGKGFFEGKRHATAPVTGEVSDVPGRGPGGRHEKWDEWS